MSLSGRVFNKNKNKKGTSNQIPNLDKLENKIAKVEKDILDQKNINFNTEIDKKINDKVLLLENKINNKNNIIEQLELKINELQSSKPVSNTEDIENIKNQLSKQQKILEKLLFNSI